MPCDTNHSQSLEINQLFGIDPNEIQFPSTGFKTITKDKFGHQLILLQGYAPFNETKCPSCGGKNMIKHGTSVATIRLLETNGYKTALRATKQRVLCKNCQHTFLPQLSFIKKGCNISENIRRKILMELTKNISMKDLAQQVNVSPSTVVRVLDKDLPTPRKHKSYLPHHLSFDEFNAGNGSPNAMSFIFSDAKTHRPMDILPDRKLHFLTHYFLNYPESVRLQVKTVTMDIYSPYMILVRKVFPNAKIILDRFHIIQHWARAFTKVRIEIMNQLNKGNSEDKKGYRRIKRYWKLLIKNRFELKQSEYKNYPLFEGLLNQSQVVDQLLSYSDTLKKAYDIYQEGLFIFKRLSKYPLDHLLSYKLEGALRHFNRPLKTFNKYKEFILNAYSYSYNNGHLEAWNNQIKTIKKTAYGFRNFEHLKKRCFLKMNRLSVAV
ncbi:ISL3 family transposase [Atopobacter sp. AH10]|uniref:ISL3 family transposase n=1 Tax=Atopobacter sp. AH10 TaxID=2315861 RepID=UPI000EF2429A|nr:ISL3 family transposase [Atopobacter sp. AH10]RLK62646.1 ISL3 family transposase [Atopobacter sp. AH10]